MIKKIQYLYVLVGLAVTIVLILGRIVGFEIFTFIHESNKHNSRMNRITEKEALLRLNETIEHQKTKKFIDSMSIEIEKELNKH